MEYKRYGNKYFIRMDRGEEVVASLTKLCQKEKIKLGKVSALGAADHITLGCFDTKTKNYTTREFKGEFEITSILGNITTKEDEVYLHLHANIADQEFRVFGGHLVEAYISGTCEMVLSPVNALNGGITRKFNEEVGLNLFVLN